MNIIHTNNFFSLYQLSNGEFIMGFIVYTKRNNIETSYNQLYFVLKPQKRMKSLASRLLRSMII